MDRRNGGDPLAPPRPPKLLPKVHRPRAPEPEMMSSQTQTTSSATSTAAASAATATTVVNTPQCTNLTDLSSNNNLNQQQITNSRSSSIINTTNTTLWSTPTANVATATIPALITPTTPTVANNIRYNRVSYNNNHIGNIDVVTQQPTQFDDYQIHHLTFLPQRTTTCSNLSRNNSHVSSSSSSSSVAANSFTRRRPPPLATTTATIPGGGGSSSAVPLLTISGNSSNNNNNNFLNHFHTTEPVATSPVTLAQPRPESERLANEYVDTPLRTAQQLQNATRMQHPAGQHDNGQTTTHHLLLLPQRELRQQQQQQNHHQHFHRNAGTAGSANATTMGVDGTDGLLHSQHNHHHLNHQTHGQQHHQLHHHQSHNPKAAAVTEKLTPKPETGGLPATGLQPINQPITKQPALTKNTDNHHPCKFGKELPALEELLDIHSIATGISTPQGMISTVNGSSPLGTPIVIGSSDAPSSLNPITCPRCDRCRCEQCQSPRPLPQTWVCNKTCLCSAESIIDYASCLCCAKALFYHCARDNDLDCDDSSGTPCVDNPCSCGPYKRTQRWGWLGALSLVLPCLWCYWPMRGCVTLCEKCYGKFARRGCRCQQIGSTSSMFPITAASNGANIVVLSNGSGLASSNNGNTKSSSVGSSSHHHHIHHTDCSTTSRMLRKGDLTPEKRLLDSSPEY